MKKILFLIIIIFSICLVGCEAFYGSDEKIEFSIDKGETWNFENDEYDFDILNTQSNTNISGMTFFYAFTYEEFLEKITDNKEPKSASYLYPNEDYWNQLIDDYDEEYFEEYNLLFYYKYEPNISQNYVYSITRENNTLVLNVNRFEGMCTALSSWYSIVVIKKTDCLDINQVKVSVNTIQEKQDSIYLYIKPEYYRKAYVEGFSKDDLIGVDNIKEVSVYASDFILEFDLSTTDENLINTIMEEMAYNELVVSTYWDYRGVSYNKIRISLKTSCYDDFVDQKLTKSDFTNSMYISEAIYRVKPHTPWITIKMDKTGIEYANKMIEQIKKLEFDYIDYDELSE